MLKTLHQKREVDYFSKYFENRRRKVAFYHHYDNIYIYRWEDGAEAYLSESWKRQVMWYVKEDSKLGMLDTDMSYRLAQTLERTAVSRKLLAFQVRTLET